MLGSIAVRGGDYSDFGSNVSSKLALRYDFTDAFALRAAADRLRAPSLQQQYYATTSTNFIGGVPFDHHHLPATDPVAVALGAKPLDAEGKNFSVGAVIQLGRASLTIDAYQINIDNHRAVENLTRANVRAYLTSLGCRRRRRMLLHQRRRHRTQGVDVVANIPWTTERRGASTTLAANFNSTDVTRSRPRRRWRRCWPPAVSTG